MALPSSCPDDPDLYDARYFRRSLRRGISAGFAYAPDGQCRREIGRFDDQRIARQRLKDVLCSAADERTFDRTAGDCTHGEDVRLQLRRCVGQYGRGAADFYMDVIAGHAEFRSDLRELFDLRVFLTFDVIG